MLRIHNLGKRYGNRFIFQGLTQSFAPGCFALCEEENTGKSTLLSIIAGELAADTGEVFIDGKSLSREQNAAQARLAFIPADCLRFPQRTGHQLLAETAAQKNTSVDSATLELARQLDLEAHLDKRFEQMSTGTRRKAYLLAAAIGNPAVIVADGPTDGFDSSSRAALARQFKEWAKSKVVLFASHDAHFVQACGANLFDLAKPAR